MSRNLDVGRWSLGFRFAKSVKPAQAVASLGLDSGACCKNGSGPTAPSDNSTLARRRGVARADQSRRPGQLSGGGTADWKVGSRGRRSESLPTVRVGRRPLSQSSVGVWVLFCASALLPLFSGVRPAAASTITTGLIGLWQFDGSGVDGSGQGNTATLNGGATFGPGLFGQGLVLNGVQGTSASLTTNNPAFDFGSTDFSLQVWVNFNSASREQTLLEKFSGCCGPGWTLTTPGGDDVQFYAGGGAIQLNAAGVIPTDIWQQVIVERSGDLFQLFWDDNLVASQSSAVSLSGSANPLLFGARDAQDGRNFTLNGTEDEVAIWDRALSTTEINALWNDGVGSPVVTPEPASLLLLGSGLLLLGVAVRRSSHV